MRSLSPLALIPAAIVAPHMAFATEYLTVPQAQKALFPDADRFEDVTVALDAAQIEAIEKLSGMRQRWKKQPVWRAEKAGTTLGWFIVDNVVGKHEFITYAAGITQDGHVAGIEILVYRETHGYEIRNANWRDQFDGKTLSDPFKLDVDIVNISGATLSCRNVTDGVKRLLALQQVVLAKKSVADGK
ncbi:MAG: FMN-binding protein [Betaproteobacteria bacterium]|nr:FMN-binding protein [Betaproteobacteria bacterium]